jgi:DNA invertase Pin-like site-specific DNA recombinase
MTGVPVAYLRRSRVDTRRPGTLSHEQQLTAIRRIAEQHGDAEQLVVLEDWGRSGREEKLAGRQGFARLEAMVAAGEVAAVYAYDLSRLGRSLITAHRLAKACAEREIPIRCADGYSPDISNSIGKLVLNVLSSIAEYYADNVQERARVTTMMRRQRGDRIGKAPYGQRVRDGKLEPNPDEDLAQLLEAFRKAGTVQGAARALNAAGVPTRSGGPWRSSNLSGILAAAGVLTRRPRAGRPSTRAYRLAGLLRCSCGATMTGRTEYGRTAVSYECRRSRTLPDHPRPLSVPETAVLPWIREHVDGLAWGDRVEMPAAAIDVDELAAKRRRILDNYEDGLIDRSARNEKLAEVDALIAAGTRPASLEALPASIDWTWPVEDVHRLLQLLVEHVQLGEDMRPAAIAWRGTVAGWAA